MVKLAHSLLLKLPPELAHNIGRWVLSCVQWVRFRMNPAPWEPPLVVVLPTPSPIRLRSRVGVAAGLDKNAQVFAGLACLGAAFVEVGTVTPLAQAGNPKPRLWRPGSGALVNHMGFNSVGLEGFRKNLHRYRSKVPGLAIFANIGKNRATANEDALGDYRKGFEALLGHVDGFVVNLSSPNTPSLVALQSEAFLTEIASVAPAQVPTWIKLSPDLDNSALEALCGFVRREKRIAGLVLTNTSREMAAEVFGFENGGLSGRPLFSRALECVSIARQALGPEKTLIGVGGIWNAASARQMREAGADLFEVYTGLVYQGPGFLKTLAEVP
ncbi:quinone-dependent dihydroorotate dehydrogenase [bacterium]|nr:quinone-dependent dihydroorotate dehydrogenase [bacterium]